MPGRLWSEVYMATPLTLSGPSTRGSPALVRGGRLSVDAMSLSPLVVLGLLGCEGESVGDAALGEFDLKSVFALRLRTVQSRLRCLAECFLVYGFAMQRLLCLERAPGLCAYASQGNADKGQLSAADLGHDRRRGKGKLVRGAVA